ncbi:MAG: restriction endonuclease subunit S [Candidatus Methanoperedens sp.]
MKEGALHELPGGWVREYLDNISLKITDGEHFRPRIISSGIPFLSAKDVRDEGILLDDAFCISEEDAKKFRNKCDPEIGDILIVSRGATVGRSCIVTNDRKFCLLGSVILIKLHSTLSNKFISYIIKSTNIKKQLVGLSGSTAQQAIYIRDIRKISISLPPLPEQRAIVSKIEQLFSDLDNGIENFKEAQAQLKLYRQSVLKAACEGKLVPIEAELARAEGRDYETADVLLARILKEQREKWNGKGKYKEAAVLDINGLTELPEGWVWANVGMISEKIQYGTSEKAGEDNSGIPVLRMGNIQDGKLIFENLKYFQKDWPELSNFLLEDGDVLFNRTNSAELVGKTSVYKNWQTPTVFASYLIRVIVIKSAYTPDFLSFFINSIFGRKYIGSVVSQQVGQANVNGTKLSKMPIPLPPLAEQRRIVAEVERRLSVSDKMEATITESLQKAESLRQSILKKAFEGKLLNEKEMEEARNASDWESAEKLLERIRQEKALIGEKKRNR